VPFLREREGSFTESVLGSFSSAMIYGRQPQTSDSRRQTEETGGKRRFDERTEETNEVEEE